MTEMHEVETRISIHEAVCVERYAAITAQLKRIEMVMFSTAGALILGLATIAWTVATK
jgi:hypothetical protein